MGFHTMTCFKRLRLRGLLPIWAIVFLSLGCGKGNSAQRVFGTVTIGSEPIRGGFVTIDPASSTNSNGRQGRAVIRDGKFDTQDGGEMAVTGPVVIRVQGCGEPTSRFPDGVPLCHAYEIKMELTPGVNNLELRIPESARVREPKGGWGSAP